MKVFCIAHIVRECCSIPVPDFLVWVRYRISIVRSENKREGNHYQKYKIGQIGFLDTTYVTALTNPEKFLGKSEK